MFDDLEIPAFLRRSPDEEPQPWRRLWHEYEEPTAHSFGSALDPATQAVLAEQAEAKRIKTQNRIAKMLARKQDHAGETWNTRTGKWEPRS